MEEVAAAPAEAAGAAAFPEADTDSEESRSSGPGLAAALTMLFSQRRGPDHVPALFMEGERCLEKTSFCPQDR